MKINKGQVYQILKALQKKGVVESTLEYPTRYTAVPFEHVIDSFIESKREEVGQIEKTKNGLISDWNRISKKEIDTSLEKFSVIEGENRIFQKISQMIKETKDKFSMVSSIPDLGKAELFGTFDYIQNHHINSNINFRLMTKVSRKNLETLKILKRKLEINFEFKGINPNSDLPIFPKMAIRDNEELILFISENEQSSKQKKKVYLCTNCKSIIQAFSGILEELWSNSFNIEKQIMEAEKGNIEPRITIYKDGRKSQKKYENMLKSAEKEILIITSTVGINKLISNIQILRKLVKKAITIKILTSIDFKKIYSIKKLISFCEIRHIPRTNMEITLIDNTHLLQFLFPQAEYNKLGLNFSSILMHTNNLVKVKKTRNIFSSLWKSAQKLSGDFWEASPGLY